MRKTKIICTLGPKSNSDEVVRALINKGANVFRLNFSHGEYAEHAEHIRRIRRLREELNQPIAIILDTKGPEVRTGNFVDGSAVLTAGRLFTLRNDDLPGDETGVSISYKELFKDVNIGDTILIDDGLIGLTVEKIVNGDVVCRVVNGGEVSNKKGINVPNIKLSLPAVSKRDKDDIAFGVEMGIDYVAASFIRTAADVLEVRRAVEAAGGENVGIIAKIENREGVDHVDQIIQVSDGVMVARGDLGVEIPIEEVPLVQKSIIKKCNTAGIISITATQMLDSMIRNPRPTRAESNDVANAVLDGTDAVMLSGETAAGKYPVEAVETMARITATVEQSTEYENACRDKNRINCSGSSITDSVGKATYSMAESLNAKAIITATKSGHTARMVAMHRPKTEIIAITMDQKVYNKLALIWGVKPLIARAFTTTDEMLEESETLAKKAGMLAIGDTVIITAGIPVGACGVTNLINVRIVGRKLVTGKGIGTRIVSGSVCVIKDSPDMIHADKGCVIVVKKLTEDMKSAILKASAVITEEEGKNIDPQISALFNDKSVITDASDALCKLPNGLYVSVDPVSATVYNKSDKK